MHAYTYCWKPVQLQHVQQLIPFPCVSSWSWSWKPCLGKNGKRWASTPTCPGWSHSLHCRHAHCRHSETGFKRVNDTTISHYRVHKSILADSLGQIFQALVASGSRGDIKFQVSRPFSKEFGAEQVWWSSLIFPSTSFIHFIWSKKEQQSRCYHVELSFVL